ncbi:MAG: hypothetical protein AVDCRST_MAG93-8826 [uncultured Chloroflexia bacterium]|uniref:Uncharacterized protein n=1 Tax=uncultured Chloroflexia bacterium TaxID=1672391 RepID=A0A6J4N339_9CHLR|nr:MAG: hypothetical protein AVDCRST_MAG93-8826 [uncultured Chloroflexia bacterium]
MPDRGARESRVQGKGRQEDGSTGQSAHDVQLLNPNACHFWKAVV